MTFHGRTRADHHTFEHVHESPPVMTVPLLLLALGAVVVGWAFHDQLLGDHWQAFWGNSIRVAADNHVLHDMEDIPSAVGIAPTVMAVLGIALAYLMYTIAPGLPAAMAARFGWLYRAMLNKWYFDEIYDRLIVRPLMALARQLWLVADATLIDGVPNGIAALTSDGADRAVKLQTGSIAVYAFSMLIGLVVLVSVFLLFR
jgi:NADH-quinone oxidoreductase subunit L